MSLTLYKPHTLEMRSGHVVDSAFVKEGDTVVGWARLSNRDDLFRFTASDPRFVDFEEPAVYDFSDALERVERHRA